MAALSSVEDGMESRVRRMRGVFTDLGLDMAQLEAATPRAGMGGPFVPVKLAADAGPFERQLYRINITRAQVERLNRTLALVPYRKPVIGEVEFTSGFGIRSDPFLGRPGDAYRSRFPRRHGRSGARHRERQSGVGGMGRRLWPHGGNRPRQRPVDPLRPSVGDRRQGRRPIKIGQVIGAVGSTGRSTGPHLHYETRIDGEAVDPQKFLRAGVRFAARRNAIAKERV